MRAYDIAGTRTVGSALRLSGNIPFATSTTAATITAPPAPPPPSAVGAACLLLLLLLLMMLVMLVVKAITDDDANDADDADNAVAGFGSVDFGLIWLMLTNATVLIASPHFGFCMVMGGRGCYWIK